MKSVALCISSFFGLWSGVAGHSQGTSALMGCRDRTDWRTKCTMFVFSAVDPSMSSSLDVGCVNRQDLLVSQLTKSHTKHNPPVKSCLRVLCGTQ